MSTVVQRGSTVTNGAVPRHEYRYIGPAEAASLLLEAAPNRQIKPRKVGELVRTFERGEWVRTGESIKFDVHGRLIDGQHRLQAIARSGLGAWLDIDYGLDPEAQRFMDAGASRTAGDALELDGEKNSRALASALRMLLVYEKSGQLMTAGPPIPRSEILARLTEEPAIRDSVAHGARVARRIGALTAPWWGALVHLFMKADSEDAHVFFEQLVSGADLEEDDPIFVLRERLAKLAREDGPRRTSHTVRAALVIKAFRYWREGRRVSYLRFSPGGAHAEAYPTIDPSEER